MNYSMDDLGGTIPYFWVDTHLMAHGQWPVLAVYLKMPGMVECAQYLHVILKG